MEKSCLPVYSPELKTLLTSFGSRLNPLKDKDITFPPTLPGRAKPGSEDVLLLGRLSKRRELNIRWRFFTAESKKILPPLQISVETLSPGESTSYEAARPRSVGFQETHLLQQVLDLAGQPWDSPSPTRRERGPPAVVQPSPFDGKLSVRWLRRRYQELLGRLPILAYHTGKSNPYSVSIARAAITKAKLRSPRLRAVHEADEVWLRGVSKVEYK